MGNEVRASGGREASLLLDCFLPCTSEADIKNQGKD